MWGKGREGEDGDKVSCRVGLPVPLGVWCFRLITTEIYVGLKVQ